MVNTIRTQQQVDTHTPRHFLPPVAFMMIHDNLLIAFGDDSGERV